MPTESRPGAAPPHLLGAAQAALASMADEFGAMLAQDLERLSAARAAWRAGAGPQALLMVAHDLRGLGALYGAPLVGRIAGSLERVLASGCAPARLVEAHVDAMLAVVREGAADGQEPRGTSLAAALEAASRRFTEPLVPQAA